ncbi:MAG: preprotein translocase subunit YajC [Pirellula sp.]|jgi:preprotein translocase YajC subunit
MGRFTTSILAISAMLVIVDIDCQWLSAQEGNNAQIVAPDQSGTAASASGESKPNTGAPADVKPQGIADSSDSNGALTGVAPTDNSENASDVSTKTPGQSNTSFSEAFFRNPLNLVLLVFLALYVLLLFLPKQAKKEQKALQARLVNLKKNDRVILNSGIHGVVANINSDAGTVTLRVDEGSNAKITVDRNVIRSVEA